MRKKIQIALPLFIGLIIATSLYISLKWWGFWVIFPWIGFSISTGMLLRAILKGKRRLLGRKVSILMIVPCLLLFVPIFNNENFQLEGVAMLVMVGFFGKGFIHYAVAKLFGPLIWGRGFCGWACWTGAILDWLPIKGIKKELSRSARNIRYIGLIISLALPAYLVFVMSYDVKSDYIYKQEMIWMFVGNGIYYLFGIPLAFVFNDKRFFCKYLCPVSLVMKPSTHLSLIKIKPNMNVECIECGNCNNQCPMGVDIMGYMIANKRVTDTECVLCSDCKIVCPVKAIK